MNTLLALYAVRRKELYDDPQLDAIRREKLALEVQAAEADQRLMEFKRKLNISDFESQRALLLQRLSGAEQARADASSLVTEQGARAGSLAQQISHEPATQALFEERDLDNRLQLAKSTLQDLEAHSAELAERYTPGSRLLDRLRKQVDARRLALNAMEKDGRSSVVRDGRNANLDQMRLDLQRGLTDLVATRSRLNSLTLQCRILDAALQGFDQAEYALHKLEREKASAEENLVGMNRLLSERHLTEAEDALRFANVRVIQPARIPQAASLIPIYIAASGFIMGIISAAASFTFVFIRRDVFLTADGLAEHFRIPVFAAFSLEAVMFDKERAG